MDTGWGSISPPCCCTSKSLATALTLLIRVYKSLKLLGKWYWWNLKSGKEFAFCYQVYMHFPHLMPIAILYGTAHVLVLVSFTKGRDWSQEGLDDRNHTVNFWQSTEDCPLPLVSLLTCRWSCVISELLFPPPDTELLKGLGEHLSSLCAIAQHLPLPWRLIWLFPPPLVWNQAALIWIQLHYLLWACFLICKMERIMLSTS